MPVYSPCRTTINLYNNFLDTMSSYLQYYDGGGEENNGNEEWGEDNGKEPQNIVSFY